MTKFASTAKLRNKGKLSSVKISAFLIILALPLYSSSQSLMDRYRLHRVCKLIEKSDYNKSDYKRRKIRKKLNKLKEIPQRQPYHLKYEFARLCVEDCYNVDDVVQNLKSKRDTMLFLKIVQNPLSQWDSLDMDLPVVLNKKFPKMKSRIDYWNKLIKPVNNTGGGGGGGGESPRPTLPTGPEPEKNIEQLRTLREFIHDEKYQEKYDSLVGSMKPGQKSADYYLVFQADGKDLAITFKVRSAITERYFERAKYTSKPISLAIDQFLNMVTFVSKDSAFLMLFTIQGEADADYDPRKADMRYRGEFGHVQEEYNENVIISLADGDKIDNEQLAFLRAYWAKTIILKSIRIAQIEAISIDAIDNYTLQTGKQDEIGTWRNVVIQVRIFGILSGENRISAVLENDFVIIE